MEIVIMKSQKHHLLVVTLLFFLLSVYSCSKKIESISSETQKTYSNGIEIKNFTPKDLLPVGATLIDLQGNNQKWIIGDIDNDGDGEIIFAFNIQKEKESSTVQAILAKETNGKWIKLYNFQERAEKLDLIKFCDVSGDGKDDLVIGWVIQSRTDQSRLYMYQWKKTGLEGFGTLEYSKIEIDDFEGVFGKDKQFEFGIWTKSDDFLTIDILRYVQNKYLTSLFPSEEGQSYTQQNLCRAEDIEPNYFSSYAIPELKKFEKEFPNDSMYDLALIKAYLKAKQPDLALKKINQSGDFLSNKDQENIPLLKAQAFFLKGEINKGERFLDTILSRKVNRVDMGEALQALGRAYTEKNEYEKANLAYRNAMLFHIPFSESIGFQPEMQFQYSLAKDKARIEVLKQYDDLKTKVNVPQYQNNFQNKLISLNKAKGLPIVTYFQFYLSLDNFYTPYANVLTWKDRNRIHEIVFMTFDNDQHKMKYNYIPVGLINEKTRKGWKATITFKEFDQLGKEVNLITKTFLHEDGQWKLR